MTTTRKPTLTQMNPTGDGWYEALAEGGAGTRYRYRLNDDLAVPDPASRFQPEDVHGPSEVIDPRAFRWKTRNGMVVRGKKPCCTNCTWARSAVTPA